MQTTHDGPATPEPTDPRTPALKAQLRRHFRALRRDQVAALGTAARGTAEAALAEVLASLLASPGPIASYAACGAEIDPVAVEAVIADLAFPRVADTMLAFHRARFADLAPGFAGILEPAGDAPLVTPRLVLVPLLAVTPAGLRLGQGAGHYDRTLAVLRAAAPVIAIGLAHDCQLTGALPADPWDQWLDFVATPTHLVDCAANR